MKSHLDPSLVLFATTFVLATFISFPVTRCQPSWNTHPYDLCGQVARCGEKEFTYPFWGPGRPPHCGHPGFQLTCQSEVPELLIGSVEYRILEVESSTNTISVARNDLYSTICPQYLHNTTSSLFNGDNFDQHNISMYYGCVNNNNTQPRLWPLAPDYRFDCITNGTQSDSYFIPTSSISADIANFLAQCRSSVSVPVERSWADLLATATATVADLRRALQDGFKLQWMAYNDECDPCVWSGGRCGSNATSPDRFVCYCDTGNFSATCNDVSIESGGAAGDSTGDSAAAGDSTGDSKSSSVGIVLGIVGAVTIVVVGIGGGIFVCRKQRRHTIKEWINVFYQNPSLHVSEKGPRATNDKIEIFIRNYGSLAPKRYNYSEIEKMTNLFQNKLGHGGFGSVYKGQLPNGHQVAVKLLNEATEDGEDFINEVASIGRTSHVNIVTLLGFCFEGNKRALLYEFMPNGSLDKFLRSDGSRLDWNTLFQVAKGIARGLEYLHRGCNTRIVHFDIKPHNILLDEDFVPKISDFGLAKLCKTKESILSMLGARGTAGYMAPEVFFKSLGGASHKSDVYSYGMMVLEMTGASKHNNISGTSTGEAYFPDWVYKQVEVGGDLGDYGVTTKEEEELARKMMVVSLWCIQTDPSDRPSISKVVEMLEGSFESLQVPPRRIEPPPARPFQGTSLSYMQSSSGERVSTELGKTSLLNSHEDS